MFVKALLIVIVALSLTEASSTFRWFRGLQNTTTNATSAPATTASPSTDAPAAANASTTSAPATTTAPSTNAPAATNASATNAPTTGSPVSTTPSTNAPTPTNASATNAPTTNAPATGAPSDAPASTTNAPVVGSGSGSGSSNPFPTLGSGSGSGGDAEAQLCGQAMLNWSKSCPGLAKFDDGQMTASTFQGVCPCFASQYEDEQFTVFLYCPAAVSAALLQFDALFCTQDSKKTKYCGEEFPAINQTLNTVFGSSDSSLEKITQTQLTTLCTECFDNIIAGVYVVLGDLSANADGAYCDEECEAKQRDAAMALSMFTVTAVFCIPNDNTDQKSDPFCLPYVMSRLSQVGQNCGTFTTEATCESNNGECAFVQNKCISVVDAPAGYAIIPPFKYIDDFCSNSCYFTLLFTMMDMESSQDSIKTMGADDTRRRQVRNQRHMSRFRKHRSMRKLQSSDNNNPSEEVLNEAEDALASMATFICLANKNGNCLRQVNSLNGPPAGCDNDTKTFNSASPTCSGTCAAGLKALVDNLGCCYSTMAALQQETDPEFYEFANYAGVAASCNVTIPDMCNPYASTPQPVTTQVSGTCDWINANATNIEVLKNGTAKALGVSPQSLQNFSVTSTQGKPCASKRTTSYRGQRRARGLQATSGLSAGFNVVARDDATAKRIAANGNSDKPIAIPAVQQAAAKTATTAKNQEIAKSAPTVAPKAVNGTAAPTTKAPTSTPSGTQPIAPPTATGSAMSSLVSVMCGLVVLAIMLI